MRTVILLLTSAMACAAPAGAEPRAADPGRGAKIYADNCGRCHNARSPHEHRDREWSMAIAHMRIVAGLPGDQARDVEAFVRASNDPPRPPLPDLPAVTETGTEIIEAKGCRACHVIGGQGGAIGPKLDGVLERRDEAWVRAQILNPRQHNAATVMPVYGFHEAQVDAIVRALRDQPPVVEGAPR